MLPEVFAQFYYYDFVYALLSFQEWSLPCDVISFMTSTYSYPLSPRHTRHQVSRELHLCLIRSPHLFIVIKIFPCKLHTILIKNEMGGQPYTHTFRNNNLLMPLLHIVYRER